MTRSVVVAVALMVAVVAVAWVIYGRTVGIEQANGKVTVLLDAGTAPSVSSPAVSDGGVAAPVDARAEITALRGSVQARAAQGGWADAAVGQRLASDDSVRAGRASEATLRLGDGVEVRLSPRSEFTVRELSAEVSKIRLDQGHVTASVDEGGKRVLRVQARGSDAEAESAGGQFGVVTDGSGQLAVATSTGSVKLSAAGSTVEVAAGETSAVTGGAPSAPRPIPSSLFLKVGALGPQKTRELSTTVSGAADPGSVVSVGEQVARVDDKGRFQVKVPLKDGQNQLAVDVTDATGRTKTAALPPITVDRAKPAIEAETTWGQKSN
ncbi:MAG: FecR domain-containing protein [Deltaproteobacteria bacterium]|nr:FecR domain-containing protein [Deltaproteobacteria bacterium]